MSDISTTPQAKATAIPAVNLKTNWRDNSRVAMHWQIFNESGRVECTLCPRHCKTAPEQMGFCKVRGNKDGKFHTFNFGKSVAATEECVETEAIYHYAPGARILSLGNIGCMMACDYCQNWQTSQVKYLDDGVVHSYTPEEIIELAQKNNIGIISWTYNDPVVWHEFVYETSKLANKAGIRTLYKSAFYIEEKPVAELIEVIDIFSVSLKSMSPEFYKKITKGELQPVLDRLKQVKASGKHLEVSQLLVMELNEKGEDIKRTIDWVKENLGLDTPLHFVGAHPAFKYTHVERTPMSVLMLAHKLAKEAGLKHCYLGNVYEGGVSDTKCGDCDHLQVQRFGLTGEIVGLDAKGNCSNCGSPSVIKEPWMARERAKAVQPDIKVVNTTNFAWTKDVKSVHLVARNKGEAQMANVQIKHSGGKHKENYQLGGAGLTRVIISRASDAESGIEVAWDNDQEIDVLPVLDRAHFPVLSAMTDTGVAGMA
jgi:pyruvate formate lyase activating enzyme